MYCSCPSNSIDNPNEQITACGFSETSVLFSSCPKRTFSCPPIFIDFPAPPPFPECTTFALIFKLELQQRWWEPLGAGRGGFGALYMHYNLCSLGIIFSNKLKYTCIYCPLSSKATHGNCSWFFKSLYPEWNPRAAAASDQTSPAGKFRSSGSSKKTISWGCNFRRWWNTDASLLLEEHLSQWGIQTSTRGNYHWPSFII